MEEKKMPHTVMMENRSKLSITQVQDVDTFDENKIVLFTETDTIIIEGEDLHIRKLDVQDGALIIDGDIASLLYTDALSKRGSKGFFKKMLK
ncbi:MAG: sporulation protein YabP [Ruminococcaceae bacterium]|nr:sporulation protein YabP [Oscillospiraceae bacterium]